MNKFNKKILIFVFLFITIFLLIGCRTINNLNVKASLLVENANTKDANQKITVVEKNISFTTEELKGKKIDFSKNGKVFKEITKYFNSNNYELRDNSLELSKNETEVKYTLFLKEKSVKVEGVTYTKKALIPFRLQDLDTKYQNHIFMDEKTGKIIKGTQYISLVDDLNLSKLELLDNESLDFVNTFDRVAINLKLTFQDKVLKTPESYPKDLKYVSSSKYNELNKKYIETLKSFLKNDSNKKTLLADLINLANSFEQEIVVGAKANLYTKDFFELSKKTLQDIYNKGVEFVKKHIVLKEKEDPSNLKNNITHILNSDLTKISNKLTEANLLVINSKYDEASNYNNTKVINDLVSKTQELKNLLENTNIITGTKVLSPINYLVKIFEENTLQKTDNFVGEKGEFITFNPEVKTGFDVSHESKLSAVLDNENVVLEVKYVKKTYFITIDLDKGTITNFDKNYIEVKHGEKINQEDINKLRTVTKQNDSFGENYVFNKYINYYTNEEFNLDSPVTKPISLKATYTFITPNIQYKIRTYKDKIVRNVLDPVYDEYTETLSELTKKGSPVYFIPQIPEGFELDLKHTKNSFNSVTSETIVEIYLKRKLVRVDLYSDTNIISFNDERVNPYSNGGSLTLKYGQKFDFVLTGIQFEKEKVENNQTKNHVIYKVFNSKDNKEFKYTVDNTITENLNLNILTKRTDNNLYKITATYSFLGSKKYIGDKEVPLMRVTYVESGSKITDKAFFAPDVDNSKAIFDLENNKGYVADTNYTPFNINENLPQIALETNKQLIFVYNMTYDQARSILINEHYGNEVPFETYREVEGTIVGKYDNIYMFEFKEGSKKIIPIRIDRALSPVEENSLKIGNLVKINLVLVENYSMFLQKTSKYNFDLGRLGGLVGLIKNNLSRINLIQANYKIVSKQELDNFNDLNNAQVKVNKLHVIEKAKQSADLLEKYDLSTTTKYYYLKVRDINNKIGYVFLSENGQNVQSFTNINVHDYITVDNAILMLAKAVYNENEIEGFYESGYENRPSLFIADGNSITVNNSNNVNLKVNFIFNNEDEDFIKYLSKNKVVQINKQNTIQNAVSAALDNEFFNSYVIKDIKVKNQLVNNLSTPVGDITEIDVYFEKAKSYIEFLLITYLPQEMKESLVLKVTTGGKKYTTTPVDINGYVVKFILNYNTKDYFIDIDVTSLNYKLTNETNPNKYVIKIADDNRFIEGVQRYVAYEGGRYNPITGLFGLPDRGKVSYQYAAQNPFKIDKGQTGLFFDAYTTNTGQMPDEAFRKFHERELFTEQKGFVETDGPSYSNMEWNRIPAYANSQTQFFVRVKANEDGSYKTNEEINSDKSLDFKLVAKIPEYEILEDGTNHKTNRYIEYKFHKGSLSNYIKINEKYHIGVLHIDVNTDLSDGKTVFNLDGNDLKDSKYLLKDKIDRIKLNKLEYFDDLNKNGFKENNNPIAIDSQDQFLIRTYINYTFTIEGSEYKFKDGTDTKIIKAYYKEKFTLDIIIPENKKIEIYDDEGQLLADFRYMYIDRNEFINFDGNNHKNFKVKVVDK